MKRYYEAYDDRYKTIHALGYSWASEENTPIILQTLQKYDIGFSVPILEIGCGEGRDAIPVLKRGYNLLAADVSCEAISFCRKKAPEYADRFLVADCLKTDNRNCYGFIYSVAVIHMLLLDEDRNGFYRFIRTHLVNNGIALICSMGDGKSEIITDINDAFARKERNHPSGKVMVAGTSLRMVPFSHFEKELSENGLSIVEKGLTPALPDFNELMYAVVKRRG